MIFTGCSHPPPSLGFRCRETDRSGLYIKTGRMPPRLLVALLAFALLPTPVQAADGQTEGRAPYVRLYTGIGVTRDSDLRIRQPALGTDLTFEQVSWEHRSLSTEWTWDSVPYMGVRAGFFFRNRTWLGVSFEVLHFKILAETEKRVHVTGTDEGRRVDRVAPMEQFVQDYRVTNGVNLVLANVQAHKGLAKSARFSEGRADLYGGFGAAVTVPYTGSLIDGARSGQYEWGRLASQLLGGVAWHLSPRWDLSSEYRFTLTTVDGAVARGDSRSRLRTHHVAFGFAYHFQSRTE